MAGVLARLGCPFTILEPDELRQSVCTLAERLTAALQPATPGGGA
jgi:hypothetical protein